MISFERTVRKCGYVIIIRIFNFLCFTEHYVAVGYGNQIFLTFVLLTVNVFIKYIQ